MGFSFPDLIIRLSKVIKEIQFAKCIFSSFALQSFAGLKKCLGTCFKLHL
jgi:hypothetical protein